MHDFNWLIAELELERTLHPQQTRVLPVRRNGHRGVKRSLASTLVRLGLRLDPAAGEGLGALDLSLANSAGGRS